MNTHEQAQVSRTNERIDLIRTGLRARGNMDAEPYVYLDVHACQGLFGDGLIIDVYASDPYEHEGGHCQEKYLIGTYTFVRAANEEYEGTSKAWEDALDFLWALHISQYTPVLFHGDGMDAGTLWSDLANDKPEYAWSRDPGYEPPRALLIVTGPEYGAREYVCASCLKTPDIVVDDGHLHKYGKCERCG
jgi:hypothetical protein